MGSSTIRPNNRVNSRFVSESRRSIPLYEEEGLSGWKDGEIKFVTTPALHRSGPARLYAAVWKRPLICKSNKSPKQILAARCWYTLKYTCGADTGWKGGGGLVIYIEGPGSIPNWAAMITRGDPRWVTEEASHAERECTTQLFLFHHLFSNNPRPHLSPISSSGIERWISFSFLSSPLALWR